MVRGATVDHSLSTGIRLTGTTGATVSGSTSHDNGLHGIGLATSPGNTLSGNTTYANVSVNPNATANGIDVDTSSPDNVVSGNLSHDNQDSGIQVYSSSHRTVVARNISWSNGDHGFDTLSSTDVRYVNNTAWGNRRDGISVEGNSLRATLANNVLVDNGAATNEYDLYVDASSAPGFSGDHDLAWNSTTTPATKFNGTVYRTIGALASATSQETHGLGIDPGLLDPAHGDFRLTPGTAAVDSADADAVGFTAHGPGGQPARRRPAGRRRRHRHPDVRRPRSTRAAATGGSDRLRAARSARARPPGRAGAAGHHGHRRRERLERRRRDRHHVVHLRLR